MGNNLDNLETKLNNSSKVKIKNFPSSCDECPIIERRYNEQTNQYEVKGCPFKSPTNFHTESWIGPWNRNCASEIRTYQ